MERIWKEAVVASSGYSPGICLEGLRKTMKTLTVRAAGVPAEMRREQAYTACSVLTQCKAVNQWRGHLWKLQLQMRVVSLRLFIAFHIIRNNLRPGTDGRKRYNR
jgi:hypothetical protein